MAMDVKLPAPSIEKAYSNNNHPLATNHNHRYGKRRRQRLSQVVDKLATQVVHSINNNNNNEIKRREMPPGEVCHILDEEEDVFSPATSSKSPHSSTDSPHISFSPLRLKEDDPDSRTPPPRMPVKWEREVSPLSQHSSHPGCLCPQCTSYEHGYSPSPISPLTPISPAPAPPSSFEQYLHSKYLPDLFRRRRRSEFDLPLWLEAAKTEQGQGSEQVETPTTPQDKPLDLSVKGGRDKTDIGLDLSMPPPSVASLPDSPVSPHWFLPPRGSVSVPVVKGDVASPTTKESVAVRYNLDVYPVVEEMPPGSDVAYVCPVCGQMFSLHDRLAKHMASRHKSRQTSDSSARAYLCEVCNRSFARSDMLTRHSRLHTGHKPYNCRTCGQIFSRSDHLSTHQRTHTGEKPYKCPQCPYAACRRDMITRHMRTHSRYEPGMEERAPSGVESPPCTSPMKTEEPALPTTPNPHLNASLWTPIKMED